MAYKFIKRQIRILALSAMVFFAFLSKSYAGGLGSPPTITTNTVGTNVLNGGTATMSVTVPVTITTLTFTWYFNGNSIITNSDKNGTVTNGNITVKNSSLLGLLDVVSTLEIHNASSTNQGNYFVKVSNGVGLVNSLTNLLSVLTTTVTNVLNIVSTGTGMTANGFQINLSGPSGSNYVIQASSDMKHWTSIATNSAPSGSISYTDASAKTNAFRFYRAYIK